MDALEDDLLKRLDAQIVRFDDLFGSDLLDKVRDAVDSRSIDRARQYAGMLRSSDPGETKGALVQLAFLVDLDDPADVCTPLGIAVGLLADDDGQTITQTEAARLLKVTRQRVNDLIRETRLEKVGKTVTRASVAKELARRYERPIHVVERLGGEGRPLGEYLGDDGTWGSVGAARKFPSSEYANRIAREGPRGQFARGVSLRLSEDAL